MSAALVDGECALGNVASLNLKGMCLFRDQFKAGLELRGNLSLGKLLVGVPSGFALHARWFGMAVTADDVAVSRRSFDLDAIGTGQFFSVALDETQVNSTFPDRASAQTVLREDVDGCIVRSAFRTQELRECLEAVFDVVRIDPSPLRSARLSSDVEMTIAALVRRAVEGICIVPAASLGRRFRAVRNCIEYMRRHIDESISLSDLGDVSGMRPRSLINAFGAFTGFTPMAYLKAKRLDGVRKVLLKTERNRVRIIDVAMDWGFEHMGHFAADYRMMFGENPSETPRAARPMRGAGITEERRAASHHDRVTARRCLARLKRTIDSQMRPSCARSSPPQTDPVERALLSTSTTGLATAWMWNRPKPND